ncbi:MAG: Rrf2 family transcriptional regulator [Bacteroidota bacterium]
MNFNKTTSYSLSILSHMARNNKERMSAAFLNKKLNIPYSYLRQVLHDLSEKGFIIGTRGREGGFILARETNTIFLSEIVQSTEGLESFDNCIMGFAKCPFNEKCPMHSVWEKTRSEILNVLRKTSLVDMLKNNK